MKYKYFVKGCDSSELPMYYRLKAIHDLFEEDFEHGEFITDKDTVQYIIGNFDKVEIQALVNPTVDEIRQYELEEEHNEG